MPLTRSQLEIHRLAFSTPSSTSWSAPPVPSTPNLMHLTYADDVMTLYETVSAATSTDSLPELVGTSSTSSLHSMGSETSTESGEEHPCSLPDYDWDTSSSGSHSYIHICVTAAHITCPPTSETAGAGSGETVICDINRPQFGNMFPQVPSGLMPHSFAASDSQWDSASRRWTRHPAGSPSATTHLPELKTPVPIAPEQVAGALVPLPRRPELYPRPHHPDTRHPASQYPFPLNRLQVPSRCRSR